MSEYMMNDKTWYYLKNGQKEGPFNESEIIKLIKVGVLEAEDHIWMLDLKDWVLVDNSLFSIYMPVKEENEKN
ncbi:MAG: DUF4339 domain-containing protein [Erysipelotrichaceae bacterium]|nr:DUF4339 domain-containing protein [Erysipelotrichaceae bacterium]